MRFFVFASFLVLSLTGCKPVWDPTFMPSGYTHHHKEYKTPPGPEAAPIGYEYSAEQNADVVEHWRKAASDLVLRAKAHDIRPTRSIYLTTDLPHGAFQSAFDHALRDELQAHGYLLADDPVEAETLFYSAYDPSDPGIPESTLNVNHDDARHANVEGGFLAPAKKFELVLGTVTDGIMGTKVSHIYEVPSFGFQPAGYALGHERPRSAASVDQEDISDGYNN